MKRKRPKEDSIMYQLMNYEHNQKLLEYIPHIRYLDMAIVFYYWNDREDVEKGACLLNKEKMEEWDYSLEELERLAAYNTPRIMPVSFQPMEELILELMGEELFLPPPDVNEIPMHVLTNQHKFFGAASILYPQVLWAVSQSLQDDLYVLPSSIHECIIVPFSVNCSKQELEEIVIDINATQLPEAEILSNHVFVYHKKEDCLGL